MFRAADRAGGEQPHGTASELLAVSGDEPAAVGRAAHDEHATAEDHGVVPGKVGDSGDRPAVRLEPRIAKLGSDRAGDPGGRTVL